MERLVKGDIIVVEFPYSDLKTYKKRPAFVLKFPKGEDVLICQMTAESYEKSVEVLIKKEDFQQGGLKKEGYVRIDKIASVEGFLIQYKVGPLKSQKVNEIVERICNYIKS